MIKIKRVIELINEENERLIKISSETVDEKELLKLLGASNVLRRLTEKMKEESE